ncbi:MAG TPA: SRPBCC domain-containing protein [Kofleriaceae bacterium]|nr:SRPBCC domain-containing protein [Kofleriaceae bacterium]
MRAPLVVRRTIRASVERVFAAWTEPAHLVRWWGPRPVVCAGAEIDLRVGGAYAIGNRFPDGSELWIRGEFVRIDRPRELVYTWRVGDAAASERVTVRFEAKDGATEVVIVHEDIASDRARAEHERGWLGCLDGLEQLYSIVS